MKPLRIAVVGPDGVGKTTWINETFGGSIERFHAIPITSKLPFKKDKAYRLFHEFLMGIERSIRYIMLRISDEDYILDRCILDAEVYAILWASDIDTHFGLWLSRLFDITGYWPNYVIQLSPAPGKARPKRSYTDEDILRLDMLYHEILRLYGYKKVKKETYAFGEVIHWSKKGTSSLSIVERSLTLSEAL